WSSEHDYRSQTITAGMQAELFGHNTTLGTSYAHGFDRTVVTRAGGAVRDFDAPLDIDSFSFLAGQVLSPTLVGQLSYSLSVLRGYQANPYRKVILYDAGPAASTNARVEPETHPDL